MPGRPQVCDWNALADRLATTPAAELAAELGCHPRSVENARRRLGIAPPLRLVRRWTPAEDRLLTMHWRHIGLDELGRRLPGRTLMAIAYRADVLGLGPMSAGTMTMREAAEYLGWEQSALFRAARALRLPLRRMPRSSPHEPRTTRDARGRRPCRRYALEVETVDRLGDWLVEHGAHGPTFGPGGPAPACAGCGRTGVPHAGRGLCAACYQRRRRAAGLKLSEAEARQRWLERTCVACGTTWDVPPERRRGTPPKHCDACRAQGRGWALPAVAREAA